MILNHMKQMIPVFRAADAVRFIGIRHEAKLLSSFDQRIDHLHAVLEVHVIVARTVGQQSVERASLVLEFYAAELSFYGGQEFAIARRSATVIDTKNRESLSRQQLVKESRSSHPGIFDHLTCGAAVNVINQRNLRSRIC